MSTFSHEQFATRSKQINKQINGKKKKTKMKNKNKIYSAIKKMIDAFLKTS